jgi:serine protease Do
MAAQAGVGDREGVLIVDVVRGGPAMKAGLRAGDVLLSVEGHEVATTRDLIELLRYEHGVGDEIGLVVARSGKEITLKATLEERMPM